MPQGGTRGENSGHHEIFFFINRIPLVFEDHILFRALGDTGGQNLGRLQSVMLFKCSSELCRYLTTFENIHIWTNGSIRG